MTTIDEQRIAAVAMLQALGYIFSLTDGWTSPAGSAAALTTAECDAMHAVLMRRADALEGCTEGSPEEAELEMIVSAIDAYEARRWPEGKEPGGKG
jgi:hypothetical protein